VIRSAGNIKHLPLGRRCHCRVDRCKRVWVLGARGGGVSGDDDNHALIIAV
jgi:hypothetical protein